MLKERRVKLDIIISELACFLERDFSSRFKNLSCREDRQLFFLAKILTQLKEISRKINENEKILIHPTLQRTVNN